MKRIARVLPVAVLLGLPLSVLAAPGGRDGKPPRPPVEAIEACVDLAEDDACSIVVDDEELSGVCMAGPRPEAPLACRPDDAPER